MNLECPVPDRLSGCVGLAHGGGGAATARLIDTVFAPRFAADALGRALDSSLLPGYEGTLAFSTDTFVVSPLFFPGGSIGDLAVNGTVNDLLCSGAVPRYLSVGFVIEEGFAISELERIADAMAAAAKEAEVEIVAGDTKVVERGRGDGVYINTSGIGFVPPDLELDPRNLRPGDVLIVTGSIGRHGMAVMSCRAGLEFSSSITSDTASLGDIVRNLLDVCPPGALRVLRDPTRGGVAATLNEFAKAAEASIVIDEESLPIEPQVRSACDLLGLDPLLVANEGIMIVAVEQRCAAGALAAIRRSTHGGGAAVIGAVESAESHGPAVWVRTPLGSCRKLENLAGNQLPRIC